MSCILLCSRRALFFFTQPAPTEIYTLSLHDALPISRLVERHAEVLELGRDEVLAILERDRQDVVILLERVERRSEEHTSELQSRFDLVCRLLLEKKKKKKYHLRSAPTTHA